MMILKTILKRAVSLTLSAIVIFSASCTAAMAAADGSDDYYKGVFYYRPSVSELSGAADAADVYAYSDRDFQGSGREYHESLATASMALAAASVSSTREPFTPEGYANKSRNVTAFLEDCGFLDVTVNEDYKRKPTKDSVGVACAHKTITDGSGAYPLLVIVPRSAGYEREWGNNFVIGASGDAKGFNDCADKCLAFAKEYIAEHRISGDIKVWTVGYSRGAAIVNLIGKKLIDSPEEYLGDAIRLSSNDLYAYTFGTPSAAAKENHPRDPRYAGIFNSFSLTELPAAMAPADMDFERYGTDRIFEDDENYTAMLQYLSVCSPPIYHDYITTAGPKLFHAKKLSITGDSISIVNDDDSYIPSDVKAYLKGLSAYLTQVCGGREKYAEQYEESFSNLIGYCLALAGSDLTAFVSSLRDNEDALYLVAALYAYFMRSKQTASVNADRQSAAAIAKELAAVSASPETVDTGINALGIAKVTARLLVYLTKSPDDLRRIAADYLTVVLPEALKASGASDEEIAFFSDKQEMEPLAHVLSFLLLGNIWQSDTVSPLNVNNEQIKNAATLIGNFNNYFYDHYNEIIISRLKADDNRYEACAVSEAQLKGYRRVVIETNAKVNGTVTDSEGNTVGVIRDGVLTDATDKWIGFTRCDDGDFFRIPCDKSYRITLTASDETELLASVKEYDPYAAIAHPVFEGNCTPKPTDKVLIDLPALHAEQQIPSRAEYRLTVEHAPLLGDVDCDGTVTILDATDIQRWLAGIPISFDLDQKIADTDGDGAVTITDVTFIQRWLAELPSNDNIGKPIA